MPGPDRKIETGRRDSLAAMSVPLVVVAMCSGIELALQLADFGIIGYPRLRFLAYDYFGFWPGLLGDWTPNYPSQPRLMFLTYGFLHSGFLHVLFNMITLYSLSRVVIHRVGQFRFLALYILTILGGAIGFWLLTDTLRPMVGASGALFGIAGALISWDYVDRFTIRVGLWPVLRAVLFLIGLNIALWWAMDGQLAWETHLGGFVTGWIVALLLDPRGHVEADAD